jgi:hypothetical protein
MATVIDKKTSIEWDEPSTRRKYPWDDWTDGQVWQVVEGKDFTSNHAVFKAQLKARAEKLGIKVKVKTEKPENGPVTVCFQFVK